MRSYNENEGRGQEGRGLLEFRFLKTIIMVIKILWLVPGQSSSELAGL